MITYYTTGSSIQAATGQTLLTDDSHIAATFGCSWQPGSSLVNLLCFFCLFSVFRRLVDKEDKAENKPVYISQDYIIGDICGYFSNAIVHGSLLYPYWFFIRGMSLMHIDTSTSLSDFESSVLQQMGVLLLHSTCWGRNYLAILKHTVQSQQNTAQHWRSV